MTKESVKENESRTAQQPQFDLILAGGEKENELNQQENSKINSLYSNNPEIKAKIFELNKLIQQNNNTHSKYFNKRKFIPKLLGDEILSQFDIKKYQNQLLIYEDGVYLKDKEEILRREINEKLHDEYKSARVEEVINYIKDKLLNEPDSVIMKGKINLKNGLYDLKDKKISKHSPNDFSLCQLPVEYDPQAEAPKFMKFLEQAVGQEQIALIGEIMGYTLIIGNIYKKAFFLVGEKDTGKSTFINILTAMLGEKNVSTVSFYQIFKESFLPARMADKLANFDSDISKAHIVDSNIFKKITGNDTITVQEKYKQPFDVRIGAKIICACNNIPKSKDTSDAYHDRIILVPFSNRCKSEDIDTSLAEKIISEELPGILNYAIDGAQRLIQNSAIFSVNDKNTLLNRDNRIQNDPVAVFLNDRVIDDPDGFVAKDDLYRDYESWCVQENSVKVSKIKFCKSVKEHKPTIINCRPTIKGGRVSAWKGIKLV